MKNKIIYIFLDIDGVLCTQNSLNEAYRSYCGLEPSTLDNTFQYFKTTGLSHPDCSMFNWPFDKNCVDNFHKLQAYIKINLGYEPVVVISSSWRKFYSPQELLDMFAMKGLYIHSLGGRTGSDWGERGEQIKKFVDDVCRDSIYISIDDDNNYDVIPHIDSKLCITPKFEDGFNDELLEQAIALVDKLINEKN